MNSLIIFIAILILGYISTNFIFHKIQSRYYIPSGIEYIVLGIIIGPFFAEWINSNFNIDFPFVVTKDIIMQLNPGLITSIGFLGFIYGLNFKFSKISKAEPEDWRVALFDVLLSIILIGSISFTIFYLMFYDGRNLLSLIGASYALSLIGSLSSNFLIKSLIEKHSVKEGLGRTLFNSSLINNNVIILFFGVLFAFNHIGASEKVHFTIIEWGVISIGISILLGILFFIFIGRETNENKLFVAVLGIVIFSSGIAYYLNISPLYINFILGATLANLSKITVTIENSLKRLSHPLSILVIVMTGFIWVPPDIITFIVSLLLFIVLRYVAKITAGKLSYFSAYNKTNLNPHVGKGLLSLDIIACAMIIDYANVYKNEMTEIVVSASIAAIVFYNVISYVFTKNLLVDAGEISGEKS